MKTLGARETIKNLTYRMSNKQRFSYVGFSKSAVLAAAGKISPDKRPPKSFTKSIINSIETSDKNFMKCVPNFLLSSSDEFDISSIDGFKNSVIYDAGMFEYYFINKRDVFDDFVNFYIRNSNNLVVSFHDKKLAQKLIGTPAHHIHVPYNDFYDRLDQVSNQIMELDGKIDYCILDCPVLSSALANRVWQNSSISILDFGKVFTIANK
jgi:hypothetical protein